MIKKRTLKIYGQIAAVRLRAEMFRHYFCFGRTGHRFLLQNCTQNSSVPPDVSIFGRNVLLWLKIALGADQVMAVITVLAVLRHSIASSYGFGVSAKIPFRSHTMKFSDKQWQISCKYLAKQISWLVVQIPCF